MPNRRTRNLLLSLTPEDLSRWFYISTSLHSRKHDATFYWQLPCFRTAP